MRRGAATLTLAIAASLLGGCVYDPYSGTLAPCCGPYGYPYGYHAGPYSPYGYPPPDGAPQGAQPGGYQSQPLPYQGQPDQYQAQPTPYQAQPTPYQGQPAPYQGQPAPYQGQPGPQSNATPGDTLAQRFAAANLARDGRLTRQQAESGLPFVAQNYDAIDLDQKGYVTLPEVRTFIERQRAAGGQIGQFDTN
jgi:hypothetical protein